MPEEHEDGASPVKNREQTQDPLVLGCEALAEVVAVGKGSETVVGALVGTVHYGCGFREHQEDVPERLLLHLPGVTELRPELVCLLRSGLTGSLVVWEHLRPKAGELMVVTGAAGMAGHIMAQLLSLLKVRVIALCRNRAKAASLEPFCERVIVHTEEDLATIIDTNYGQGLDAVIDSVGGDHFAILSERLAPMGRMIVVGASSERADGASDAQRVNRFILEKGCTITGFCLHHHRERMQEHLGQLLR